MNPQLPSFTFKVQLPVMSSADVQRVVNAVFGTRRISYRPRWWPSWLWPNFWPFVESYKAFRRRAMEAIRKPDRGCNNDARIETRDRLARWLVR